MRLVGFGWVCVWFGGVVMVVCSFLGGLHVSCLLRVCVFCCWWLTGLLLLLCFAFDCSFMVGARLRVVVVVVISSLRC